MNEVQKYLKFLYMCACDNPDVMFVPTEENQGYYVDLVNDASYFDYKKIYDTLSNFAFLTLMNNSHIEIDRRELDKMVNLGEFTRIVNPRTFEGENIEALLKKGTKTKDGVLICDEFGQESLVTIKDKKYVVKTNCHPVDDYDWLHMKKVHSSNMVNIIRNGMIHGTSTDMLNEKEDSYYKKFLKETEGQKSYSFRSGNDCVVILATENWIREFKKVFFLDSYCFTGDSNNEFSFPRFLPVLDKNISSDEDLELLLKNTISTKITIKDPKKNFMEARLLIEDDLFERVLNKDLQLKYVLKKKQGSERLEHLENHQTQIKELITNVLKEKGYQDFDIEFHPVVASKHFDDILNIWKTKVSHIKDFYKEEKLKDQVVIFSRIGTLIPNGGFYTKENHKHGLTPQLISLFLTTVNRSKKDLSPDDKFVAMEDLEAEGKITPIIEKRIQSALTLNNKSDKKGYKLTNQNIDAVFKHIAPLVDKSKYEKVCVQNCFDSYYSRHEFAFMTAYASIYNGLIETGFYEKACAQNKETGKYPVLTGNSLQNMKYLDMSNFYFTGPNGKQVFPVNTIEKLTVLSSLRNAIVHGGGKIDYSTLSKKVGDTELTFTTSDGRVEVHTTVDAVINLFDNRVFYQDVELYVKKKKS